MGVTAEMILVEPTPITLAEVPVWSCCRVEYDNEIMVRFLRPDGLAGEVMANVTLTYRRKASHYTVLEILGPLPSGNRPEDARPPYPPGPVKLSELGAFVFARVYRNGTGKRLYCHDGRGTVHVVIDGVPVPQKVAPPDQYTVVPGSQQWELKILEGEEPDDAKPPPTNVKEILHEWLELHGYDGLRAGGAECGCELADLLVCDAPCDTCHPAYRGCDPSGEAEWMMYDTRDDAEAAGEK